MHIALAEWFPGNGIKWIEYRESVDPIDRYTTTTINGVSAYTDDVTGLLWASDSQYQISTTWGDAFTHCIGIGTGWRLPTRKEFISITNTNTISPATSLPNITSSIYWTASDYAPAPTNAWYLSMNYGFVSRANKTYSRKVVCIHDPL